MRSMPAAYSDGSYSLSGADRPNPMEVSETLSKGEAGLASNSDKSVLLVFFGKAHGPARLCASLSLCVPVV